MHWSKPKYLPVGLICTTALASALLTLSISLMLFSVKPAYGDGLTQEILSDFFWK